MLELSSCNRMARKARIIYLCPGPSQEGFAGPSSILYTHTLSLFCLPVMCSRLSTKTPSFMLTLPWCILAWSLSPSSCLTTQQWVLTQAVCCCTIRHHAVAALQSGRFSASRKVDLSLWAASLCWAHDTRPVQLPVEQVHESRLLWPGACLDTASGQILLCLCSLNEFSTVSQIRSEFSLGFLKWTVWIKVKPWSCPLEVLEGACSGLWGEWGQVHICILCCSFILGWRKRTLLRFQTVEMWWKDWKTSMQPRIKAMALIRFSFIIDLQSPPMWPVYLWLHLLPSTLLTTLLRASFPYCPWVFAFPLAWKALLR